MLIEASTLFICSKDLYAHQQFHLMRDAYKFLGLSFLNCFEYRESIRSLRPQWPYSTTVLRCLWHFYDPTVYNANWFVKARTYPSR